MIRHRYSFRNRPPPDVDKLSQMIINSKKIQYFITHCILILCANQKYVSIYLNCEQDISVFVLRMKLPAAAKDQQDKCHQVKIDVDQEVAHDLASVEHVDEMSTTKYHQPDYMYKSEASYVIEFIRAKYKHCQTTKQGICYIICKTRDLKLSNSARLSYLEE